MTDRRKRIATAVAGLLVTVAGCAPQPDGDEVASAMVAEPDVVKLSVSDSAKPLLDLLSNEARDALPGLRVAFLPGGHSSGAAAATHMGDADVGVLTRPLTPAERGYGLRYLHMARDGLAFATHPDVGVRDLSAAQLRAIYSGTITDWGELGGRPGPIVVLDRPEHTSPKLLLRASLFGGNLPIRADATVLERPSMMNATLASLENSIGFTSLGEIISESLPVSVISIDGIDPTPDNVADGAYPLARFIGLVIRAEPGRAVMRFVDFVYGPRGHEVMTSSGYVPTLLNLVIATIPERNVLTQEKRYRPLAEHLSRRLGRRARVSLRHLASYDALVHEFLSGDANAAFFGSFAYALTRARVPVEPVARPERDGVSTYRGLILVRRDSGIRDWRGLEGRNFAMIAGTTAGDLFPQIYLRRQGVGDPGQYFGEVVQAGSHEASIRQVFEGRVAAGAAKDLVFQQMARDDPRLAEQLVALAESEPVPENALIVRTDLDTSCFSCHDTLGGDPDFDPAGTVTDLIERLRAELLALDETEAGRTALEALGAERFLATTDSDYRNLYDMVRELGIDLAEY